ncbi:MAG: hypothetical protein HZY75_03350 [Nocardioidaceae bacterium]|nr:MAG: hypothetical protein HZY75_03350 [Nocardioidaceae bacterium]
MSRLTALLARIAPAPLARLAAQLRGDLAVSVVVHADDDSIWFLGECLAALARQRRRPRQVLAVVTATPISRRRFSSRSVAGVGSRC